MLTQALPSGEAGEREASWSLRELMVWTDHLTGRRARGPLEHWDGKEQECEGYGKERSQDEEGFPEEVTSGLTVSLCSKPQFHHLGRGDVASSLIGEL